LFKKFKDMKISSILAFLFFVFPVEAEEPPIVLFDSHEPLELILETDFREILDKVKTLDDRQSGFIKYSQGDQQHLIPVRTEPRGNYRRDPANCHFPPLSLKFPEENLNTVFQGCSKLKLVVHCRKSKKDKALVAKEYLCYRFYNLLTDSSFRARPAYITYVDYNTKDTLNRHFTFFIERTRDLRNRLAAKKVESEHFKINWLNDYDATKLSLFQLLIGNTDWGVFKEHNVKGMESGDRRLAVPYDFDWSGFVNAPYARPHPKYPIKDVTQRHFIGKEADIRTIRKVKKEFLEIQGDVYELINNDLVLSDKEKKRSRKYIASFYEILNKDRLLFSYLKVK